MTGLMMGKRAYLLCPVLLVVSFLAIPLRAQNFNATLSGTVVDPSGAGVPNAVLELKVENMESIAKATSNDRGEFTMPNLTPRTYNLTVNAPGFKEYIQNGIQLLVDQNAQLTVKLQLGSAHESIEVTANASPLDFTTPTLRGSVTPNTVESLPLMISGQPRAAAAFVLLFSGVATGSDNSAANMRVNGGLHGGGGAALDGVDLQEGLMSQNGPVTAFDDWQMTPDMVQEVGVEIGNYSVQYGDSESMEIVQQSKSGTNTLHGGGFEYLRNNDLNATPWGVSKRPVDQEHEFGGYIGGPAKVPGLWSHFMKTYFYVNLTGFRVNGGTSLPILTVPTAQEKQGNFNDYGTGSGTSSFSLIPIYEPVTPVANPGYIPTQAASASNLPYVRPQFMGCDGASPNVICTTPGNPNYFAPSAEAAAWLSYAPNPNVLNAAGNPLPFNNYTPPHAVPNLLLAHTNYLFVHMDHNILDKDHIAYTVYYEGTARLPPSQGCNLPVQICNQNFAGPEYSFIDRFNWDHTFSPTLINNARFGYQNRMEGYQSQNAQYASAFPTIKGVPSFAYPPQMDFGNGYDTFGDSGNGFSYDDQTSRGTYIANDTLNYVKGAHTFLFGGEYRNVQMNIKAQANLSGTYTFDPGETGLEGFTSGNAMASFFLGQVDNANANFCSVCAVYPRAQNIGLFASDTWKLSKKLTFNYGLRWDMYTPAGDKWNHLTSFDPVMANPGAGGLLGALAYAGNNAGAASLGRRTPEYTYHHAFAPRIGLAYALSPTTVVRAGYGIYFDQAFYPGWGGGHGDDGYALTQQWSSSTAGLVPAFVIDNGFPTPPTLPPVISNTFDNGRTPGLYRPFDANRLPYTQQWNLTVEHQFPGDFHVKATYSGNRAIHLMSDLDPINHIDNLSDLTTYGSELYDTFQPGQTTLDGVSIPYSNWVSQMTGCSPTVGQALLPYPQFCGNIDAENENRGWSNYNALQLSGEKRMGHGLWSLTSFTWSKTMGTSNFTQQSSEQGTEYRVIAPSEFRRVYGLALDDTPYVFSEALTYNLPFGHGKRFGGGASGVLNEIIGGWQLSTVLHAQSGTPLLFRSSTFCNIPGQFAMGCVPGIISGQSPFASGTSWANPTSRTSPVLNPASFESGSLFNFYGGVGSLATNYRTQGYHNEDLTLAKNFKIGERFNVEVRADFANIWNWHTMNCGGSGTGEEDPGECFVYNTDITSPSFGLFNGNSVTTPRVIQLVGRITF